MGEDTQGVVSIISFPIDQDQSAVSVAIRSLLQEGWMFDGILHDQLRLRRSWEVTAGGVQVAIAEAPAS